MRIDLHMHSAASDGELSPAALINAARTGGLDVVALTDHDTVAGVAEAIAAAGDDIDVIPGIEISSTYDRVDLHILGYRVDPAHPELEAYAVAAADRRRERMRRMVERLRALGVDIDFDDVIAVAGSDVRAIGRPHLARALVDHGHVRTFADAFDRYIRDGGPAYLPVQVTSPRDAIRLIHDAGGLAVWAHPPFDRLEVDLASFVEWGLDGIECIRPQNSTSAIRRLATAAREHDLLITGGSDWHGEWHGPLGSFHVTPADISDFFVRAGL